MGAAMRNSRWSNRSSVFLSVRALQSGGGRVRYRRGVRTWGRPLKVGVVNVELAVNATCGAARGAIVTAARLVRIRQRHPFHLACFQSWRKLFIG
jgi:hypothetical protein